MSFEALDGEKFSDERRAVATVLAAQPPRTEARRAVGAAVRIMGEQFVLGSTIERALKRAAAEGFVCSFDMLGEGARTAADADRYEAAYAAALHAVGSQATGMGPEAGHGVSVK